MYSRIQGFQVQVCVHECKMKTCNSTVFKKKQITIINRQ